MPRLPFVGSYNTRPGTTVLTASSGFVGIGIVGLMIVGATGTGSAKDHRLLNCLQITEVDPVGGSKRLYVVDRPGWAVNSTPAAVIGNAIMVWLGQGAGTKVMSCFGTTNSTLYDGTTGKGAITGLARDISETRVSNTATLTIASDDSTGWYYQDGGSATKITDVDFPGNASRTTVGGFAHLNGYPFIMDSTTRVYNGDQNSVTAWTADSYLTANSIPDVGVGVVTHGRDTVVAFCKEHLEVFRIADNPIGSPLSRVEGSSQLVGSASFDAITKFRDTIYFVGTTKTGTISLYAYNGGPVTSISPPVINTALAVAGPSNIYLSRAGFFGRNFIIIVASTSTFVYCIEEQSWHEWTGQVLWHKCDGVRAGSSIVNYAISKTSTSGKVFVMNPSNIVYTDNGVAYTSSIQTAKWDAGTMKRKFLPQLDLVGDQSDTTMNITFFDDDYQTPSTTRSVSLNSTRPRITRGGSFKRRAFVFSHTASGVRLEGVDVEFTKGS